MECKIHNYIDTFSYDCFCVFSDIVDNSVRNTRAIDQTHYQININKEPDINHDNVVYTGNYHQVNLKTIPNNIHIAILINHKVINYVLYGVLVLINDDIFFQTLIIDSVEAKILITSTPVIMEVSNFDYNEIWNLSH